MSPRFRLRDLLLLLAILGLAFGLIFATIVRWRALDQRVACENNMRRLGAAFRNYHDSAGFYPTEIADKRIGASGTFYYDIATFIQISDRQGDPDDPIREYLCAGRRNREVGPKADFAYGANSEFGISVLGAPRPLTRGLIDAADGTAFTLLLSHKVVRPSQYDGSGPNDLAWYDKTVPNSRDPLSLNHDSDALEMWKLLGSPHGDGVPSLFVDGHVEVLPYVGGEVLINNVPVMAARWAYNDGNR